MWYCLPGCNAKWHRLFCASVFTQSFTASREAFPYMSDWMHQSAFLLNDERSLHRQNAKGTNPACRCFHVSPNEAIRCSTGASQGKIWLRFCMAGAFIAFIPFHHAPLPFFPVKRKLKRDLHADTLCCKPSVYSLLSICSFLCSQRRASCRPHRCLSLATSELPYDLSTGQTPSHALFLIHSSAQPVNK